MNQIYERSERIQDYEIQYTRKITILIFTWDLCIPVKIESNKSKLTTKQLQPKQTQVENLYIDRERARKRTNQTKRTNARIPSILKKERPKHRLERIHAWRSWCKVRTCKRLVQHSLSFFLKLIFIQFCFSLPIWGAFFKTDSTWLCFALKTIRLSPSGSNPNSFPHFVHDSRSSLFPVQFRLFPWPSLLSFL